MGQDDYYDDDVFVDSLNTSEPGIVISITQGSSSRKGSSECNNYLTIKQDSSDEVATIDARNCDSLAMYKSEAATDGDVFNSEPTLMKKWWEDVYDNPHEFLSDPTSNRDFQQKHFTTLKDQCTVIPAKPYVDHIFSPEHIIRSVEIM